MKQQYSKIGVLRIYLGIVLAFLSYEVFNKIDPTYPPLVMRGWLDEKIPIVSIFVLAVFVGFEVVSKVSSTLHTPLMSGANAIHGVILVGAIIVADHSSTNLELGLSVVAIILATINMVGGFVVTDRMLEMFKGKKK